MTRFGYVMTTYFAMLVFIGLAFVHPAPRLIWNATASTPTGLYALRPAGQLHALDLVAVRAPEPIASYLADGGFLPKGVPLLKHVMALPGQTVCRAGDTITVDHIAVAHMDTVVRRILGIGGFGRNEGKVSVEEQRLDAPGEAGLVAGELTNLRHGKPPLLAG